MTHPTIARLAKLALQTHALDARHDPITIGSITLLPHQSAAVHWLQHRIDRFGGALLADPPGLGKTFVALAIAHRRAARPLVIAPAALRTRWFDAATAAAVPLDFVSTERLSAPKAAHVGTPAFVIIDEAHHLRTASTRRHRRTATLCAQARVLLLTATPIHNRLRDLEQITALFHLPPERTSMRALRRLTLRRTIEQIHAAGLADAAELHIPVVQHRRAPTLPARTYTIARAISRIPAITDATRDGHALLQLGLLHALQSSDAACDTRIRRRIAATLAIEHAARANVAPTPALRRAWTAGDDAIQLAMPQLLGHAASDVDPALAERAAHQRAALERLRNHLHGRGDARRAAVLRRFARWCKQPVVAFTQFTATAEALYRHLHTQPGIALLCGAEARIASGVIPRAEVLTRLLARDRRAHAAVRLLITTDVLSEGLSLAGVATIVHLDLPWTAARLDQRVGRAARIGAPVHTVRVVALPAGAPAGTDVWLRDMLDRKRGAMQDFERQRRDDLSRIALLRQFVHRTGMSERPDARWVTVRSAQMHDARVRIIALVRVRGRRQLVVYDDGRLHAPVYADWEALTHAEASQEGCGRRYREMLREMLQDHADEEEMRRCIERHGDARLEARRSVDARLLDGGVQARLALAPRVTSTRRDLMQRTGRSHMPTIAELLETLDSKVGLVQRAVQALDPDDDRVLLCGGIVILPVRGASTGG